MLIKKEFQGEIPENKILNTESYSQTDTYSCDYINNHSGGGAASGDTYPIGAIAGYAGDTAPTNWLMCDGSAVSRTTYAQLFQAIGTSYGAGDGSTTFNLPNLKGRVPVGKDSTQTEFDTLGETGGEKTHTLTEQEMPDHNHDFKVNIQHGDGTVVTGEALTSGLTVGGRRRYTDTTANRGYGEAHNNLQPYQVTNYIIKAFQSAGVVANVAQEYTQSDEDTYSCNYVNNITQKPTAITLKSSGDQSYSITSYATIKVNNLGTAVIANPSSQLTADTTNSKIVIGPGVSKVKVSGAVSVSRGTTAYICAWIRQNNNNVALGRSYFVDWYTTSAQVSNMIINVQQGDYIELFFSAGVSGSSTYTGDNPPLTTFLTVEVVE